MAKLATRICGMKGKVLCKNTPVIEDENPLREFWRPMFSGRNEAQVSINVNNMPIRSKENIEVLE